MNGFNQVAIYFIQAEQGGLIKIGYAADVCRRFRGVQAMSPVPLKILGVIPLGNTTYEKHLHRQLRPIRVHGEWFEPTPELLDFIEKYAEKFQCLEYKKLKLQCGATRKDGTKCKNRPNNTGFCHYHQPK
jgi:hypothetical protein